RAAPRYMRPAPLRAHRVLTSACPSSKSSCNWLRRQRPCTSDIHVTLLSHGDRHAALAKGNSTAWKHPCYNRAMSAPPPVAEIRALHDLPLPELLFRAQTVHRQHHRPDEVQLCTLLSVKTGGCPEDCAYCPQSAHYDTPVRAERSLGVAEVLEAAER